MLRVAFSRAVRQAQRSSLVQHRAFAEKALQELTWDDAIDELGAQLSTDEAKRELAALKSTFYDIKSKYEALAKPVAPIDWEGYKQKLDPQLVEMFKKAYDTTPYPDYPSTDVEEARAVFAELEKEGLEIEEAAKKRMKEIQAEITKLQAEQERLTVMTIDEALAEDPELAAEIDKEISEGKWF